MNTMVILFENETWLNSLFAGKVYVESCQLSELDN